MRRYIIALALLINHVAALAQPEWDTTIPEALAWKADPRLTTLSTALSGLRTNNLTTESFENKKNNKVGYLSACLSQQIILDRPCEIRLTAKNANNYITGPKTHVTRTTKKVNKGRVVANVAQSILLFPFGLGSWLWNPARETVNYGYTDNQPEQVYWGYTLSVKSSKGVITTFTQRFCHSNGSQLDSWNSETNKWQRVYGTGTEYLKLVYDRDKTLKLYSADRVVKTFADAAAITYFSVDAGCEAKLEVYDFDMRRMTAYGVAKPKIDEAIALMSQENWHGASKLLNEVQGSYQSFNTLFLKGYCQMAQSNIRTAIDDLTKAINFPSASAAELEKAYYLRGYCKAQLEDIDCVNDMRKGGEDGRVWLREMQLEDFYPDRVAGQGVSRRSAVPKKSLDTSKKPPLRK